MAFSCVIVTLLLLSSLGAGLLLIENNDTPFKKKDSSGITFCICIETSCLYIFVKPPTTIRATRWSNCVLSSRPDPIGYQNSVRSQPNY